MEVKNMLLEVALQTSDDKVNKVFKFGLAQVFQKWFLAKIEEKLPNMIQIKEIRERSNVVAYQQGNKIIVNAPEFYPKSTEYKVRYLLHEFLHILQKNKKLMFFRQFKELDELGKRLYSIVKGNLVKPLSVFLTSKNQKLPTSSQEEVLAYLMNFKTDWTALKPEGKREFINELRNSKIFNLNSSFWQKRLI